MLLPFGIRMDPSPGLHLFATVRRLVSWRSVYMSCWKPQHWLPSRMMQPQVHTARMGRGTLTTCCKAAIHSGLPGACRLHTDLHHHFSCRMPPGNMQI
jgi:hypothetical protein